MFNGAGDSIRCQFREGKSGYQIRDAIWGPCFYDQAMTSSAPGKHMVSLSSLAAARCAADSRLLSVPFAPSAEQT